MAARVLDELDRSAATTIVRPGAADGERASRTIRQYHDKDFSLTDAIRFAVMERLGIVVAFSFDHHFAQYGFLVATPETIS